MSEPQPIGPLARVGLGSRGLVYLLIGWLAVRIAFFGGGQQADRQGAMQDVAHHLLGRVLLVVMAAGFAGYAAWRAYQVVRGNDELPARVYAAARGLLYLFFAVSTLRVAISGHGGSGSDASSKKATAGVIGHTGGVELVAAVGVGFGIAGVVLAVRGILRKFEGKLRTSKMSEDVQRAVAVVGVAGATARGIVFAMVGGFLVNAAVDYDPAKAQGLDGSLRSLAHGSLGRGALVVVAAGLACFGLYSLAEARYREI
jgi:hypothetical protein